MRGVRLIEVLNQRPYKPLIVEHQLVLIFAAISGYLDSIDVKNIARFKDVLFELIWDEEAGVLGLLKELSGADLGVKGAVYDLIIQAALRASL
jgi:F-type H+/Na+-transporting ATPase subunit alpha